MGKPLAEARAEVEKCATACDYYAEHAAEFLADEPVATSADRSWIGYEPVGVVLAVMPWNFPLWQVIRFAAPALMAGNAALLKHSPNTTGCALAIQDLLTAAGAPDGLFTALVVAEPEVPAVTQRLIEDPRVGAVTITGSERAGRSVGSAAGRAIKKSVLELGGSDLFVVLADADLPRVAALAARGRFLNAGQSCISPKRLVVDATVAEEFTRLLVAEVETLVVGDPERPDRRRPDGPRGPAGGPAPPGRGVGRGRRPVSDRRRALDRPGHFCAPTVLADVAPGSRPRRRHLRSGRGGDRRRRRDEAVRIANDTRFGLGASLWTRTPRAVSPSPAGSSPGPSSSTPSSPPTCGCPSAAPGRSGYGRELAALRDPRVRERPHLVGSRRARRHRTDLGASHDVSTRRPAGRRHRAGDHPGLDGVVDAALAAVGAPAIDWVELPMGLAAIPEHGSALPVSTLRCPRRHRRLVARPDRRPGLSRSRTVRSSTPVAPCASTSTST